MDNQDTADDLLAERLNGEPVILFGYTNSEFMLSIQWVCAITFPVALGMGFLIGKPMSGLGLGFLLSMGGVVLGGRVLQRLKRGKPDYYFQTQLLLRLHHAGLSHCHLIRYQGTMSLGRTLYHRY
jgi:conjugative transfer region protein (TIGR03750 family)